MCDGPEEALKRRQSAAIKRNDQRRDGGGKQQQNEDPGKERSKSEIGPVEWLHDRFNLPFSGPVQTTALDREPARGLLCPCRVEDRFQVRKKTEGNGCERK